MSCEALNESATGVGKAATVAQEQPTLPVARENERLAFHEAAHAVAMWRLGYGIKHVTIDPDQHTLARTERARSYDLCSVDNPHIRRFMVEQNAMVLHAGSVAEQTPPARQHRDSGFARSSACA